MQVNYYDINGNKIGEKEIKVTDDKKSQSQMILRYIKVFLFNQHQGTSSTKTKAEVSGGGKKPWTQKHTGRARSGSSRSPIWVGGGIAHGPRPRDISRSLPKNWKKDAFKSTVISKIENSELSLIDFTPVQNPKTKQIQELVTKIGSKNPLIIHDGNKNIYLSARNLMSVKVCDIASVNPMDIISADAVLVEEASLPKLEGRL